MPGDLLLVLIIREAGLRSTLAAQLSLAGADLVTGRDIHDPAVQRRIRAPALLVLDAATARCRSEEWLEALVAEPHWQQVVVLGDDLPATAPGGRLVHVHRAAAISVLATLAKLRVTPD